MITTAIGSVPYTDPDTALKKTWSFVNLPFWPQLPKRFWRELMIPQFAEGMPGVEFDDEARTVVCRYDATELERFWSSPEKTGAISPLNAAGLHAALKKVQKHTYPAFKVQTTGPVTFCLSVYQRDGSPIMGNPTLREAAWMLLAQKAIWQVRSFGRYCDKIYHFFDEPVLASFGANPSLTPELIKQALGFVFDTLRTACPDVTIGIHCCGNTDWAMVLSTRPDILSFDAFYYGDTILLYGEELKEHFLRGGTLALGIVPTDETVDAVDSSELAEKAKNLTDRIAEKVKTDVDIILTPACGTGSLTEQLAERVFNLLYDVAVVLRA